MLDWKPSRRAFVTSMGIAGLGAVAPRVALGASPGDETEPWLAALKGKHRQLFHAHDKWTKGIEYAIRYRTTYQTEYGVRPGEVNSVLAAHGKTGVTTYVDAAWEKYGFGKMFDVKESPKSDRIATTNVFYAGTDDDPGIREALAAGVVVLSCRTALRGLAHELADTKKFGSSEEIEHDLTSMLVPGVVLVPAMIIAIGRAQEHGCTYAYTG